MSQASPLPDPFEFLKKLWAPMGLPMPGMANMVSPTTNIAELEKRINDLKSVENWLSLNLEMVRTTIQGLEAQKATIAAFQSMQTSATSFTSAASDAAKSALQPRDEEPSAPRRRKRKAL